MNSFDDRKSRHKSALRRRWEQRKEMQERLSFEGPWRGEIERHNEAQWRWRPKAEGLGPLAAQAFGRHVELGRLVSRMVELDASDAHLESRGGERRLMLRVDGKVEGCDGLLRPDELLEQIAQACSVKDWPWENQPQGGRIQAQAGAWNFQLRVQSLPAYPQGFDLVLRNISSPLLTPEQERERERWERRRLEILEQANAARQKRKEQLKNEFETSAPQGPSHELLKACSEGRFCKVAKLLSQGADPNAQRWSWVEDAHGALMDFPLKLAAKASGPGKPAAILALLDAGADPDLLDQSGWTALMCAAEAGKFDAVEALMPASLVDAQGLAGESALALAANQGAVKCIQILVAKATVDLPRFGFHGAGPDGEPKELERAATALSHAACFDNFSACEALLEAGADPRVKDGGLALWEEDWDSAKIKGLLTRAARRLDEKDQIEEASRPAQASGPSVRL